MAEITPIRVAIVGLGRIGLGRLVPFFLDSPERFQLVAVCDLDKARRDAVLAQHPSCHTYRRLEDLLTDSVVELVIVATRTDSHFPDALAVIKSGKHVVVLSPLGTQPEELVSLRAESIKSKVKLFLFEPQRLSNVHTFLRRLDKQTPLVDIYRIDFSYGEFTRRDDWLAVRRCAGGVAFNGTIDLLSQALEFSPMALSLQWADVRRVAAVGDAEDTVSIYLRTNSNFMLTVNYSTGQIETPPYCVVYAENGQLTIPTAHAQEATLKWFDLGQVKRKRASVRLPELEAEPEVIPWQEATIAIPQTVNDELIVWESIYQCMRGNQAYPLTLDATLEATKIVAKVKRDSLFS